MRGQPADDVLAIRWTAEMQLWPKVHGQQVGLRELTGIEQPFQNQVLLFVVEFSEPRRYILGLLLEFLRRDSIPERRGLR